MDKINADLIEVFSSFQGEGPYVGYKQLFVRFAGCNLSCSYCDTEIKSFQNLKMEQTPGKQDFEPLANPVDVDTLFYYLKKLDDPSGMHHSVSLTGGEPLLQTAFLKCFLTENHVKHKFKIYLETNGTLCDELEQVVKLVDIVSMDIKIPSATKNPVENWHQHKKFLEILADNKPSKVEYFVKIVVNNDFSDYELYNVLWCMGSEENNIPLILQPDSNNPPDPRKLLDWQARLLSQISDVRIIPQSHKIIKAM